MTTCTPFIPSRNTPPVRNGIHSSVHISCFQDLPCIITVSTSPFEEFLIETSSFHFNVVPFAMPALSPLCSAEANPYTMCSFAIYLCPKRELIPFLEALISPFPLRQLTSFLEPMVPSSSLGELFPSSRRLFYLYAQRRWFPYLRCLFYVRPRRNWFPSLRNLLYPYPWGN